MNFGCWVSFCSCPWPRTQTTSSDPRAEPWTFVQRHKFRAVHVHNPNWAPFAREGPFGKSADSQNSFTVQPPTRINERKGTIRVRSELRCVQSKGTGLLLCVGIQIMLNLLSLRWTLIKSSRSSLAEYFPSWIVLLLYFFSPQFSDFNVNNVINSRMVGKAQWFAGSSASGLCLHSLSTNIWYL